MSHRFSLVLLLAAALGAACTNDDGKPDAGTPDKTDAGTGDSDGGEVDAGDPGCDDDTECPANQYCERSSRTCLDAKACSNAGHCDYQDVGQQDYCAFGACWCDLGRNNGTCLPRTRLCEPCQVDSECGDDDFIYLDYIATCRDLGGSKVCLPVRQGGCPAGYVSSQDGTQCLPAGGSCGAVPTCARDSDCDPYSETPVCNKTQGFCVATCLFDYQKGESNCPPGQVCHVDPRLLKSDNPNFGGGSCGPSCSAQEAPYECATAEVATVCEGDGDPLLVNPLVDRCRPASPSCVRDADCPQSPETSSRGFCNRETLECETGCRRESDCIGGYKCSAGQCVEKTCIENGGAIFACAFGMFCCGEEGGPECPTGVSLGQCYEPTNPPWCGLCNAEGATILTPGTGRPSPSRCVSMEETPAGNQIVMMHSCDPAVRSQCPRSWGCDAPPPCTEDVDCGPGGKCGRIQTPFGTYSACVCTDGATCPERATCKLDANNQPSYCAGGWCNLTACAVQ